LEDMGLEFADLTMTQEANSLFVSANNDELYIELLGQHVLTQDDFLFN